VRAPGCHHEPSIQGTARRSWLWGSQPIRDNHRATFGNIGVATFHDDVVDVGGGVETNQAARAGAGVHMRKIGGSVGLRECTVVSIQGTARASVPSANTPGLEEAMDNAKPWGETGAAVKLASRQDKNVVRLRLPVKKFPPATAVADRPRVEWTHGWRMTGWPPSWPWRIERSRLIRRRYLCR
jgi:hypothetical protein